MSSESVYDCLFILDAIGYSAGGATRGEIQVLSYLGCLISVYEEQTVEQWGYSFMATRTGAPYAEEIATSLDQLVKGGFATVDDPLVQISDRGRNELRFAATLPLNKRRQRFLDAATAAALAMPLPLVADALSFEPGLRRALHFVRTRALLDETGIGLLEAQFNALSETLGNEPTAAEDLMVPTVVWLTYLASKRQSNRVVA